MKPTRRPGSRALVVLSHAYALAALFALGALFVPAALAWGAARLDGAVRKQLAALVAHPVDYRALRFSRHGLSIDGFHARRNPQETVDPIDARHVFVSLDWWQLVRTRKVVVRAVELDGLALRFDARTTFGPSDGVPWTSHVLTLRRDTGLERVQVRDGSVRLPGLAATALDGALRVGAAEFEIQAQAGRVVARGTTFEHARATIAGRSDGVDVRDARGEVAGGTLEVHGHTDVGLATAQLELRASGVFVERVQSLAPMALPVAIRGRADATVRAEIREHGLAHVSVDAQSNGLQLARGGSTLSLTSIGGHVDWTGERVRFDRVRAETSGATIALDGDVSIPVASEPASWQFRANVNARSNREALGRIVRFAGNGNVPINARRVEINGSLTGRLGAINDAKLTARVRADDLRVPSLGPDLPALTLPHVSASVERTRANVALRDVAFDAHGTSVRGSLSITGHRIESRGRLVVHDLAALRAAAPRAPFWVYVAAVDPTEPPSVAIDFHVTRALARGPFDVDGHFDANRLRVGTRDTQPPGLEVFPLALAHASGAFRARLSGPDALDAIDASVSDLQVQTPVGSLIGSAELSHGQYHVALAGRDVEPRVVRRLVPGTILGGHGVGTLVLDGALRAGAVPSVHGHVEVTGARYALPADLPINAGAIPVARFAADYAVNGDRVALTNLTLRSALTDATGTISTVGPFARLQLDVSFADTGRIARAWAPLDGVFRGGRGTGHLDVSFDPHGVRGAFAIQSRGGNLVLPSVAADFATHPIDSAGLTLRFSPDRVAFSGLSVRGPRGNLDANGSLTPTGALAVRGRAWLTHAATSALLRPNFIAWVGAHIVGLHELGSNFSLDGDAHQARLHAAIVHTVLWHLASPFVPRDIRNVVRGRVPLWVDPHALAMPAPRPRAA